MARRVRHYGKHDVYQLGVLYYRMLEGGAWPWEDSSIKSMMRPMSLHQDEPGIVVIQNLIRELLAPEPDDRSFPMDRIENILRDAQSV
jgi:hypothetical protein